MGNATYVASLIAPFLVGSNTCAVQIDAANNATVKVKRIRIHFGDGREPTTDDMYAVIQYCVNTATSGGNSSNNNTNNFTNGSAQNIHPADANDPSPQSVVTFLGSPLKITQLKEQFMKNSNTRFHWQAENEDDKWIVSPGNYFTVNITPAAINTVNTKALPLNIPIIPHFLIQQLQVSTIQTIVTGGRLFG